MTKSNPYKEKDEYDFGDIDDSDLFAIDIDADRLCAQRSRDKRSLVAPYSQPFFTNTPSTDIDTKGNASVADGQNFSLEDVIARNKRFKLEEYDAFDKDLRAPIIPDEFEKSTTQALFQHYGYSKFRPGQLEVMHAIISQRRDCSVFWATGSGKSLCYQLPALHTSKTAVVISPLISLMQDQCNKLNGSSQNTVAVFLGSSQHDATIDRRALIDGEFLLVFMTPEKLCSGNTVEQLERLNSTKGLSVIAIDEAHCVSEWGHDFRPQYRQIRNIRSAGLLLDVPFLSLTGTATPRVRQDVITSLLLKDPLVQVHSFDRANLRLQVHRKPPGKNGFQIALASLVKEIQRKPESTIIYAPTIHVVEDISLWLSAQVPCRVMPYHSKLSDQQKEEGHLGFLVGTVTIIVATVAFGMGIDKTNTRRVIHYGPPKTLEEYVQQIGRAGRDGLPAQCVMFADHNDFSKYDCDFYMGKLRAEAKENTLKSLRYLQSYAMDAVKCRRAALLRYFSETPLFGERCGTCDNCLAVSDASTSNNSNLSKSALVVLLAIDALKSQPVSVIEKVMKGQIVENYRYKCSANPLTVKNRIELAFKNQKYSVAILKELISLLASYGYLEVGSNRSTISTAYNNSWTTYDITHKGEKQLETPLSPVLLPVSLGIRVLEDKEEEKRQLLLSQFKNSGVNIADIPEEELEKGDGEVVKSFKFWMTHMEHLTKLGKENRIEQLQDLRKNIEDWRFKAAKKFKMSPTDVMPAHLIAKVAYTSATSLFPMDEDSLHACGVRSGAIKELAEMLQRWSKFTAGADSLSSNDAVAARVMIFPKGEVFSPSEPWKLARIPKAKKNGALASWESSYMRFIKGEHPQTIAVTKEGGKPIQVRTVAIHILDALTYGKPVPLDRIAAIFPPPTYEEWDTLKKIEAAGVPEMDVVENEIKKADFLTPVMGVEFIETPYNERKEEESFKYSKWCDHLSWYLTLRRAGYVPTFS